MTTDPYPDDPDNGTRVPDPAGDWPDPAWFATDPEQHAARQLHPGAPEAIGAAIRALLGLAWTWTLSKLRRRPDATFHEAWCPGTGPCECWRFLLESDPTAERIITELDNDQRYDR